jgi:hypothetical protein
MNISNEQLEDLGLWRHLIRDPASYTTTYKGEQFTINDYAQMAFLIWRRMGRSYPATGYAWRRLMENNCTTEDVMALVAYYVFDVQGMGK